MRRASKVVGRVLVVGAGHGELDGGGVVRPGQHAHLARALVHDDEHGADGAHEHQERDGGDGHRGKADGEPDFVLIGPDDPTAMTRHTEECRKRGYRFVADPSQQLAFGDGELIRGLVDGAAYLFSNEYESHLIEQKTGWSRDEVLSRVGIHVVTLGAAGVRIDQAGQASITVKACEVKAADPTGVGDAFRAGFLAALSWDLGLERAAQVGCTLAAYVVESVGTQEYRFTNASFIERMEHTYGAEVAAEVAHKLH